MNESTLTAVSEGLIAELVRRLPELDSCVGPVRKAFSILKRTFTNGGKLLVCGNGGSAADAEHLSGELMKGFRNQRPLPVELSRKLKEISDGGDWIEELQGSLPVIPLVSNAPLVSAIGNDLSADLVFAQQVLGYGTAGDTLLAISTSGSSPNVIRGVIVAKALGLTTIGLTGGSGGLLKNWADVTIQAPATETYRIQEYHLPIYHLLAAMLEEELF